MADTPIETWRAIIVGDTKSWVLFENGTCVILMRPEHDLAEQARRILAEYGPVHTGTPSGDFSTISLDNDPGWVVTCHHPDILTYVVPEELEGSAPTDLVIGILGRGKRDQDGHKLHVLHVEDKRGAQRSDSM